MSHGVFPRTRIFLSLLAALAPAAAHAQAEATDAKAGNLATVVVSASADASAEGLAPAYAGGQVAKGGRVGILGTQDNLSTPFTVTSYTNTLIQNQQAASVGDVLLNDAAVRVARGFGSFQQSYLVRGMPMFSDDVSYNGLYGLLPRQYLDVQLVERVEVLRGANAFLNGAAPGGTGLGGAVNVVPKRAGNEPLTRVATGVQSGGLAYVATDLARRFNDDKLGLRLNAARRDGETAVEGDQRDIRVAGLGVDYRDGGLRISGDLGYQVNNMRGTMPSVTVGAGLDVPGAPDASKSNGQPWTYSNEKDTFGTLRAEYDFNRVFTGWIAGGMRSTDEDNSLAGHTTTDMLGNSTSYRFANTRHDFVTTAEAGLRAKFATGAVGHTVTLSASKFEKEEKNAWGMSSPNYADNIYDPLVVGEPAIAFRGGDQNAPKVVDRIRTQSVALADTLSLLRDTLLVTGGLRYQQIQNYGYNYTTGAQEGAYSKNAITPVAGVVYKFTPQLSAYANYIEGLIKGGKADETHNGKIVTNAGEMTSPYRTRQVETGLKFDAGRLGGSIGVFQSRSQVFGYTETATSSTFTPLGEQRNRGVELSAYGEPVRNLKLLAGLNYLQARTETGSDAIGSPKWQGNVGAEVSVPQVRGLAFDSRVIYTSAQYADVANTQRVPSWTRVDVGVRYAMPVADYLVTLRGRIENLADRNYWASAGGYPGAGYLTVGAPRTYVVSATMDF
ncbi:MAG: TonB-dependent receptor [Candidatus Dactylopiibacterium sp.]|nr:TonB-dependent receptor [Candidatus Dactylopiibacterium sp.]